MTGALCLSTADAHIECAKKNYEDVRNRSLSVLLPQQADIDRFSVDIGGSLSKTVFFKNGALHFDSFETEKLETLLDYLKPKTTPNSVVHATGGGAFKFGDRLRASLSTNIVKIDEIECLIKGSTFFISEIPDEVYYWDSERTDPMITTTPSAKLYPYLIVNIGSGVGFIKVEGPDQFERIGGSALGGGTLWGLLALLTPAQTFDEMLTMAMKGDNRNVDMLVGDIYGRGYAKMGLSASTIASFFAKAFKEHGSTQFDPADISRSLLIAVSYNIAQLAYLHAQNHDIENIYFAGSYIRGHRQTVETITNGIQYWSKDEKKAFFFRHEGYLGAMGAFLSGF